MNSPRPGSSVYPFTPFPVERIRFAEEPYLEAGRIMSDTGPMKTGGGWVITCSSRQRPFGCLV